MPNTTGKTRPIALRVPIDVYEIMARRVAKHNEKYPDSHQTIGQYASKRLRYDIKRKHYGLIPCPHPGCINGYVYHGTPCPVCKGKKYIRKGER